LVEEPVAKMTQNQNQLPELTASLSAKWRCLFVCIMLFAYTGCALKPSDKNCS